MRCRSRTRESITRRPAARGRIAEDPPGQEATRLSPKRAESRRKSSTGAAEILGLTVSASLLALVDEAIE